MHHLHQIKQQFPIEMPFPTPHRVQGFLTGPRFLVCTMRSERVEHITHRAKPGFERYLVPGKAVRIACPVDLFVVVQTHIKRHVRDVG